MKPKILGVTLARGGSKSIPKKNIVKIANKPLLYYTIKEAKLSKFIDRYIVSTDSLEISNVAKELDAEVPFIRPAEYASDTATSAIALKHAVLFCENQEKCKYDYVVELMATNPFKKAFHIDELIQKHIKTRADSVIGVCKLHDHHPARIKKIENDFLIDFNIPETSSRRQDLKPDAYIRNGSIYSVSRDLLVEKNYRYGGNNSRPYIMPDICNINIDTPNDLLIANALLSANSDEKT